MSDVKDDNLESYGEWVAKPPLDIQGSDKKKNTVDEVDLLDLSELATDLPLEEIENYPSEEFNEFQDSSEEASAPAENEDDAIFDDIEFPSTAEDLMNDEEENALEGDTSLTPEELSNITFDQEVTTEEPEEIEEGFDGIDPAAQALGNAFSDEAAIAGFSDEAPAETPTEEELPDFGDIALPDIDETPEESAIAEEAPAEEALPDFGDISIPDFDETAVAEETPVTEEVPTEEADTEEISLDGFGDGEIDLGSFMGDSGGGAEFSFDGGSDIDLDDFMSDSSSSTTKAPAEIQDEQTLDINLSFDNYAKELQKQEEEAERREAEAAAERERIQNEEKAAMSASAERTESLGDTIEDEIDLSEFGFDDDDANIGMTSGPEALNQGRKEIVDYDMKVTVDNDSKTPSVQDVVNGKFSKDDYSDSEEDEITEQQNYMGGTGASASPEISEKGKEILEQIMGELSALRSELKNLKTDFADLKSNPSKISGFDAELPTPTAEKAEDTGFFGSSDGDDTIALSGSEISNILNSAEFLEESADESGEVSDDDLTMDFNSSDMEEPTIASMDVSPEDLENTTDEFGDANVLPEEISIPKNEEIEVESSSTDLMDSVKNTDKLNDEAVDNFMAEDASISDTLTAGNLDYLSDMEEADLDEVPVVVPEVSDIVRENISLQEDDEASIGIDNIDIDTAFEEADADESDIMDSSLAEKDSYEDSVSDIMKENISLKEDNEVSIDISGQDIDSVFEEADADESDIIDDSLAAKDAYEKEMNKNIDDEEIPMNDDFAIEEPSENDNSDIPLTLDNLDEPAPAASEDSLDIDDIFEEPVIEEPAVEEPVFEPTIEEPIEEPTVEEPVFEPLEEAEEPIEEPVFEEPAIVEEAAAVEEPVVEEPVMKAAPTAEALPKGLKAEIVSVLSYMDQLLENLPEEKITEFAKSEHFVTYKKLFDELGLS